ncbi:MAG: hypothetical protein AB8B69_01430 [Chitinophagales bacterium]
MTAALIIIAFLVIFPLFWLGITYLIAKVSGWGTMAKYYHTKSAPEGYTKSMASGRIGWANYSHVLNIVVNKEGLYMGTILPFRLTNPPLFIPWEHIELQGKVNFFLMVTQKFSICTPNGKRIVKVFLSRSIFEEARGIIPHSIDGNGES